MRIAALLLGVALGLPTLAYADDDGSGPDASVLTRVDLPRDPRSGMEVGSIAIEKRPAGSAAAVPVSAARQQR